MDDLIESILEGLFEHVLDSAFNSRRVARWVKTLLMCLMMAVLLAMFGFVAVVCWQEKNIPGIILGGGLFFGFLGMSIWYIPKRHRDNWAKEDAEAE